MIQVNFSVEDLERLIESLIRYSAYLIDHALRMEVQKTPQGDAAGRKLREASHLANKDLENLQLILRRRIEEKTP